MFTLFFEVHTKNTCWYCFVLLNEDKSNMTLCLFHIAQHSTDNLYPCTLDTYSSNICMVQPNDNSLLQAK